MDHYENEPEGPTPVNYSYTSVKQSSGEPSQGAPASNNPFEAPPMNTVDLGAAERKEPLFPSLDDNKATEGDFAIFEITVSDPEKKGEGMYAYVSYKVNTKVEVSPGKYRQSSVTRRYSDFAWLRKRLVSRNDGWLIPPLPEKAVMANLVPNDAGRFSPVFVDARRRGLELFLNRVAKHKELAKNDDLKLFLHGGQEFQEIRTGKAKPVNAKEGRGFMDYLSSWGQSTVTNASALVQTVSTTLATNNGKEREKSKDDITCESIGAYADALQNTVGAVHKNVSTLTKRTKEIANAWFEFGFTCTLLGQFETEQDEQHLGNAFAKLGNCADKLSVLMSQQVDSQMVYFQEPFEDFLRTVDSVKEMLAARQVCWVNYQNALSHLESKQASLTKYQGRPGKEEKAQALEQEVAEAQRKVDSELYHLQQVTERVFSETARFRQEKRVNFKHVLQDFVRMQIDHTKKVQNAWESILGDIQNMPFD